MRLLLIHSGADLYGASRSCLRLAGRLQAEGHGVSVVLPFNGPLREELQQAGVEVCVYHGMSLLARKSFRSVSGLLTLPGRVAGSTLFLRRRVREFHADIVHSNTATVFLCGGLAARLSGVPHVWHVREDFGDFAGVWRIYQWFLCALANRIICVSEFAARQFRPERIRRKVRVIHNGFPRSEFLPRPEEEVRAFREAHRLRNHRVVGLIGRINTFRKGHLTFLEAARIIREHHPEVVFVLAGSPFPGNEDHLIAVREKIKELGLDDVVRHTGDVDQIQAAYQAMDIVVQASGMPEGFPGVVVEAMALGVPVVGTRLGGTVEQIADGETGILVEPNNAASLAAGILRLLEDEATRRAMGRRGRERYERLFEFDAFFRKMSSVYAELLR